MKQSLIRARATVGHKSALAILQDLSALPRAWRRGVHLATARANGAIPPSTPVAANPACRRGWVYFRHSPDPRLSSTWVCWNDHHPCGQGPPHDGPSADVVRFSSSKPYWLAGSMYLLVADETNKNAGGTASFLIYGGLIVDAEKLSSLNSEIEAIRVEAGYTPEDEFKFDTRARPSHVTQKAATDAKRKVIAACIKYEAVVIVQVSSHELIKSQSEEHRLTFAANTILAAYNKFLTEKGAHGICVLDNMPIKRPGAFLAEKFTRGLIFPDGKTRRLDRIALLATSNLNAGHILTAVDVVLGTFRFCVNKPPADGAGIDHARVARTSSPSQDGQGSPSNH